jgi:hypothetical protein
MALTANNQNSCYNLKIKLGLSCSAIDDQLNNFKTLSKDSDRIPKG